MTLSLAKDCINLPYRSVWDQALNDFTLEFTKTRANSRKVTCGNQALVYMLDLMQYALPDEVELLSTPT